MNLEDLTVLDEDKDLLEFAQQQEEMLKSLKRGDLLYSQLQDDGSLKLKSPSEFYDFGIYSIIYNSSFDDFEDASHEQHYSYFKLYQQKLSSLLCSYISVPVGKEQIFSGTTSLPAKKSSHEIFFKNNGLPPVTYANGIVTLRLYQDDSELLVDSIAFPGFDSAQ